MRALRAALVQMTVQEKTEDSLARAEGFLRKAKEQGAQLALLPEMFCCPYQTKNFPLYAQREGGEVWQALSGMAKKYDLLLAAGSVPEVDGENRVYNTAYVFDREGRQIAKHRKLHLFDVEVEGGISFRESDTQGENGPLYLLRLPLSGAGPSHGRPGSPGHPGSRRL